MVIDLCARLSAATARAEAMLAAAPRAGLDLFELETARRRLVVHEHEHDRTSEPSRRRELVRLMDREIVTLATA